eukprot:617840_1
MPAIWIIHCRICLLLLRCLLQIKYPTMTDKTILRRFIHHLYLFRSMTIPIIPRVTIIDQQVPFNLFENKNMIVILRKVSKYVEQYGTNPPFPEPRRIRTNYKQRMDTVLQGPVLENYQHLHDQLYSDHPPIISTKLFADIYPHDDVACDLKDFENDRSFVLYQFPDLVSSSKEEMYPPTDDEGMEELIELKEMECKPMPTNNMIDTTTEDA